MPSHRFFRAGGLPQARVETGSDIAALLELDPKLWVALACPTTGLELDEVTLKLIDSDSDGRIRLPEVLMAIQFTKDRLVSLDSLIGGRDGLALTALASNDAGKALAASAREVLRSRGKADAGLLTVADVSGAGVELNKSPLNGDGIVVEASTDDPAIKKLICEIVATVGGEPDRSGGTGVSQTKADAFFTEVSAFLDWDSKLSLDTAIRPIGDKTAAAHAAMKAIAPKIDDYFVRSKLAVFDGRVTPVVNRSDADYASVLTKDLSVSAQELTAFPLARIEAGRPLPLNVGINPAFEGAVATFIADTVNPLFGAGRISLSFSDWLELKSKLSAFEAWLGTKPAGKADALGALRLTEIAASDGKQKLAALIASDLARASEINGVAELERLVRYHRDLHTFIRSFVSFADFYDPKKAAIFQAGVLYLDGRSCELCVRVADAGKHVALAGLAQCYLVYCDCSRLGSRMTIAAMVSDGDADGLMVGRNGLFKDRKGQDWDATVTRIVENPISIREAFWAPYKRVVRYVEEQAARRAAEGDTAARAKLATAVDATTESVTSAPKTDEEPVDGRSALKPKLDLGSIALIGVAVSGIAALVGTVLSAIFGLGYWIPLGMISILLAISLPSMVIAAMKLRQRSLGPILDACGWAVNGRAKINVPLGRALTELPAYPASGATDAFADKRLPWTTILVVVSVLYLFAGLWLHDVTPVRQLKERLGFDLAPREARTLVIPGK
ncbi:MAG: hypothetical protein HYV07_16085 [Deltaproteobacteria bacterium]|nr:hypothetical protein [Deltaproteobacteria bacterium]